MMVGSTFTNDCSILAEKKDVYGRNRQYKYTITSSKPLTGHTSSLNVRVQIDTILNSYSLHNIEEGVAVLHINGKEIRGTITTGFDNSFNKYNTDYSLATASFTIPANTLSNTTYDYYIEIWGTYWNFS